MPEKKPVERGLFRGTERRAADAGDAGAGAQMVDAPPSPFLFSMINRLSVLEAAVRNQRLATLSSEGQREVLVLDNEEAQEEIRNLGATIRTLEGTIRSLEATGTAGGVTLERTRNFFTAVRSAFTRLGNIQSFGGTLAEDAAQQLPSGDNDLQNSFPEFVGRWFALDSALVQMESHLFSAEE